MRSVIQSICFLYPCAARYKNTKLFQDISPMAMSICFLVVSIVDFFMGRQQLKSGTGHGKRQGIFLIISSVMMFVISLCGFVFALK